MNTFLILSTLTGIAAGAAFKPLSDIISVKLLKNRKKDFTKSNNDGIIHTIISAVLGGAAGFFSGFGLFFLFVLAILFIGNIVATCDIQHRIIPNETILALLAVKLVFGVAALLGAGDLPEWNPLLSLAGLAVLGAVFFIPSFMGNKVGYGDIKLAMAIGFCVELMPALWAVCFMGVFVVGYGLVQQNIPFVRFFKMTFPMGPFLCAAQIVSLLLYSNM